MFTDSEAATNLATGSVIAPIVEESLKGLAVLAIFLFFRLEFDSLMDGIVYASVTALGFAATENAFYIFTYGFQQAGYSGMLWMIFVRVVLVGWQHPFYTAFIGIGLAIARLNRNILVKLVAPVIGWGIAVFVHSIHNTLSDLLSGNTGLIFGTVFDWTGWFFMFLFILWAIHREQRWISYHLREEVALGTITPRQYRIACSAWTQSYTRLGALFTGKYRMVGRFYQLCAELAHKKQQRATLGEEGGNTAIIERLRAELTRISTLA